MKRIFLFILTCFIIAAGIYSAAFLPADTKEIIETKYNNWSGVIRIWVVEDSGITSWLNQCAAHTEKELDGIYINISEVSVGAILNYRVSGINPPDIIIYPSSLSPDASGLYPITASYPIKNGIPQTPYSAPILLRPRFWIHDRTSLPVLPGDMSDVSAACSQADLTVLVALSTGLRPLEGKSASLPGLDLGLGTDSSALSPVAEGIPCRIDPDIEICDNPRSLFIKGEVSAFIGGISDVLTLSGSYDIAVSLTGEYAYADEILLFSIIDKKDSRTEACLSYLDKLMTHGQASAARAQAFPAVTDASAWTGNPLLASAESGSEGLTWLYGTPASNSAAYQYIEGKITADEAIDIIITGIRQ